MVAQKVSPDLEPSVHCTQFILCSTAECKRGFSMMNIIVTDTHNKLLILHVTDLLFSCSPVKTWNTMKYMKTWLRKHHLISSRYSNKSGLSRDDHIRPSLEIVLILWTASCCYWTMYLCTVLLSLYKRTVIEVTVALYLVFKFSTRFQIVSVAELVTSRKLHFGEKCQ